MSQLKLIAIALLVLSGCGIKPEGKSSSKDSCDNSVVKLADPIIKETPITFNEVILPQIQARCVTCHDASTGKQKPFFTDYDDIEADNFALAKKLVTEVVSGRMPKNLGPLAPQEVKLFTDWQTQGFPKSIDSIDYYQQLKGQKISYTNNIAAVITASCLSCHGTGGQTPELTDYNMLKADKFTVAKEVVREVIDGDMPKIGELGAYEKALFSLWSEQNFPENGGGMDVIPPPLPDQAKTCNKESTVSLAY